MTKAMCSKISKKKHLTWSQDENLGHSKENALHNQSIATGKENNTKNSRKLRSTVLASKENVESTVVGNSLQNSTSVNNNEYSLRKSERHRKSCYNTDDFIYNIINSEINTDTKTKRNILSDKTNSPLAAVTKEHALSKSLEEKNKRTKGKKESINLCMNFNPSNKSHEEKSDIKPHIPVYKAKIADSKVDNACNVTNVIKETVYDFDEIDENEEPVKKKKKKRKPYVKKPKVGPKALTINNIKYSSTESLVSLPEKPISRKKVNTKVGPSCQSFQSVNNLNDTESTCSSVQSFMSHPSSYLPCNKQVSEKKNKLSILHETHSENLPSPIHESSNSFSNAVNPPDVANSELDTQPTNQSSVLPKDINVTSETSFGLQQRCYPSKRSLSDHTHSRISQCASANDTLLNQLSHCSANISTGSSHDFLSSTPCKRGSLVVLHNSVFDDSHQTDVLNRLKTSTGLIKEALENTVDDKYFGFDEPEELEEPLVSPIKSINLPEPKILPRRQHELFGYNEIEHPKLDPKEVIEMLKASIPKTKSKIKKQSDVYESDSSSSSIHSNSSLPINQEVETTITFTKVSP